HGFARPGDPYAATWVYATYAAAGLAAAWFLRNPTAAWAGWLLLLASFVQFVASRTIAWESWTTALLTYATLATAAAVVSKRVGERIARIADPARLLAVIISALAVALTAANLSIAAAAPIASRMAWVAGLWFVLALAER